MSKLSQVFNKCMYNRKEAGETPSRKPSKSDLHKDKQRDRDKEDGGTDEDYEARALELSSQQDMYMPAKGSKDVDLDDGRSDKLRPHSQYASENTLHGQSEYGDEYTRRLEADLEDMQRAFLHLTANYARMQFRLRQIVDASPYERGPLLRDLERMVFEDRHPSDPDDMPNLQRDMRRFGTIRRKQNDLIAQLRMQLTELSEAMDMDVDRSEQHNLPGEERDKERDKDRDKEKEKGRKSVRQQGGGYHRFSQDDHSDVPLTPNSPTYIRSLGGQQYGSHLRRPQFVEPARRRLYLGNDRRQQQVEAVEAQPPASLHQRLAAFQQKRCDYVSGE